MLLHKVMRRYGTLLLPCNLPTKHFWFQPEYVHINNRPFKLNQSKAEPRGLKPVLSHMQNKGKFSNYPKYSWETIRAAFTPHYTNDIICITNSPKIKITMSQKHFSPTLHQSSISGCENAKNCSPVFIWPNMWAGLSLWSRHTYVETIHQEVNLRIWRVFQALNINKMTQVSRSPWKIFGQTWIR